MCFRLPISKKGCKFLDMPNGRIYYLRDVKFVEDELYFVKNQHKALFEGTKGNIKIVLPVKVLNQETSDSSHQLGN